MKLVSRFEAASLSTAELHGLRKEAFIRLYRRAARLARAPRCAGIDAQYRR